MTHRERSPLPPEETSAPAITVCRRIFEAYDKIFLHDGGADRIATLAVLEACFEKPMGSLKELQQRTGLQQSHVSRIVSRLENASILVRAGRGQANASKAIELSLFGIGALREFDQAIRKA